MIHCILVQSPNGYKIDPAITVDAIAVTAESDFISRVRSASGNFLPTITDDPEYEIVEDLAYIDSLVIIPTLDLCMEILERCHNSPLAGHYGNANTIELITHNYWWPGLR
jgi:hypothetical protein